MTTFVALVPGVPALLPQYRGGIDPVPELRAACREAVAWLVGRSPSGIELRPAPGPGSTSAGNRVADPLPVRVARSLLGEHDFRGPLVGSGSGVTAEGVLVVANGSAARGEKAPGHLDPRSFAFDDRIEAALAGGDAAALADIDLDLGRELLADGLPGVRSLAAYARAETTASLLYADDPYGVRYWVATWECVS